MHVEVVGAPVTLIRRRPVDAFDNEHLDRPAHRFQLQSELFLHRRHERRTHRRDRCSSPAATTSKRRTYPARPSRRALGPWLQAGSELFVRARERHDVDRLLARLEVGCEAKALDEQGAHSLAATITTSCAPELAAALIVVAIIGSF